MDSRVWNVKVQDEWGNRTLYFMVQESQSEQIKCWVMCKHWNILADKQARHNTYQAGCWNISSIILVSLLTDFFSSTLSVVISGWGQWWHELKLRFHLEDESNCGKVQRSYFSFKVNSCWSRVEIDWGLPGKFQFFPSLLSLSAPLP